MKAAVFTELKKIEIREKDKPVPASGQAVIKVERCGICGSDMHGYTEGPQFDAYYQFGCVMGHEFSGTVEELGIGVHGFAPGDRVVVLPMGWCGNCDFCLDNNQSNCACGPEWGIGSSSLNDGAFAEYILIKKPEQQLVKLPDNVSFEAAALVEPLTVGFHGVVASRFKPGDITTVIGAGPIGLAVIQSLKIGGAAKIIVLEISPERGELAKKLGADAVINAAVLGEAAAMAEYFSLTNSYGADIVYECSGADWGFSNAQYLMKSGGQVIVLGVIMHEVKINPTIFLIKNTEMKGILCYTVSSFKKVVELLSQDRFDTVPMISETISLKDINDKGFQRLLTDRSLIKILVKP